MRPMLTQNAHYIRITELEKQRDELLDALNVMLIAVSAVDAVADYGLELMPAIHQATRAIENTEVQKDHLLGKTNDYITSGDNDIHSAPSSAVSN